MEYIIGLLTVVMVVDSLLLILLVLIQLPKKEAGMGLAFGGAATDALFGAGSGTVLTKITKYAAGTFFVLSLGLSTLQRNYHHSRTSQFQNLLNKPGLLPTAPPPAPAPATPPAAPSVSNAPLLTPPVESTNLPLLPLTPPATATNVPAPPATNAPSAAGTSAPK